MKNIFRVSAVIILMLLIPILSQAQTERIISFSTFIRVHTDASFTVNEEIKVYAGGVQIKRGIFRSLPEKLVDIYGNSVEARYEILDVLKNGVTEPYHTERANGFIIIYIGEENTFLEPGEYTYSISYNTPRQVRFFDTFDEVYWNVTGTEWAFMIEQSEVTIKMPNPVDVISQSGYTGYLLDTGSDYVYSKKSNGDLVFKTTRMLAPNEGLTIAFSFAKGIITAPTSSDKFMYFVHDNLGLIIATILFLLTFFYFLIAWFRVGRDPQKGAIAVMYFPPEDLSPEAMRYIMKMGFDKKAFTAAIINMAVKKFLIIDYSFESYTLTRTGQKVSILNEEERTIAQNLFGASSHIVLKNNNHSIISSTITAFGNSLKKQFQTRNFFPNTKWFIAGVFATIAGIVAIIFQMSKNMEVLGPTIWVMMFGAGSLAFLMAVVKSWRKVKDDKKNLIGAILATIFMIPFLLAFLIGGIIFIDQVSIFPVAIILLFVAMDILFHHLLKAPTINGRMLMDRIEGFKEYLGTAEKDELNLRNPPDKTPELFEKYLPYAIALDVENNWGTRFNSIIAQASADNSYYPAWYTGIAIGSFSAASFASGMGSTFASAVSSSSVSPSSGSSGGGSSGGGGGGGGGGGW